MPNVPANNFYKSVNIRYTVIKKTCAAWLISLRFVDHPLCFCICGLCTIITVCRRTCKWPTTDLHACKINRLLQLRIAAALTSDVGWTRLQSHFRNLAPPPKLPFSNVLRESGNKLQSDSVADLGFNQGGANIPFSLPSFSLSLPLLLFPFHFLLFPFFLFPSVFS